MDYIYWRTAAIMSSSIIMSAVIWLIIYAHNATDDIGFDGPAGAVLAMAILAGWVIGTVIAISTLRPFSKTAAMKTLPLLIFVGIAVSLAAGYAASNYAISHYPDGRNTSDPAG